MQAIDKSILITGCSSGIGYASAHFLRDRGWSVFASCRQDADCQRLTAEGFVSPLIDYSLLETIASGCEIALQATDGKLGRVFNNGAYAIPGAVEDLPVDALRAIFEANFFGYHDLTKRVLPAFRQNQCGRIINCSSVLGLVPYSWRGAYVSSKYALEGLTDVLRLELTGTDIVVSLLEPGPITSRIRQNAVPHFEKWIDRENSPYKDHYQRFADRLYGPPSKDLFELSPETVAEKLLHALESNNPKPRYFVTKPTWIMSALKRITTTRALDRIIQRGA